MDMYWMPHPIREDTQNIEQSVWPVRMDSSHSLEQSPTEPDSTPAVARSWEDLRASG